MGRSNFGIKKVSLMIMLLCICHETILAQQPAAAPAAVDMAKEKIGFGITNMPETGVFMTRVWPEKLLFFRADTVSGTVDLVNAGKEKRQVLVKAHLTCGIDRKVGEQEQKVEIEPSGRASAVFKWPAKDVGRFGHAMVAEVLLDGKVISRGEEFFGCSDSVWDIAISGNHPVGFTADHVKDMEGIDKAVDSFRAKYVNTFEKFFWAPDDFGEMTPKEESWYSGQARYHERADRIRRMCDRGREIGVLPTTYGKSIGSGSFARDLIRKHPEYVYGYGGPMEFGADTEELAKWQKLDEQGKGWQSCNWAMYNMNDPNVVRHGIDEIIGSMKQFGWAAVRFDGHFIARTGKIRVNGTVKDFTADDADRQSAANHKALKDAVWKVNPAFGFGENYVDCDLAGRWQNNLRDAIELCRGGGHIMDEYANQIAGGNHPLRKWDDFSVQMVKNAEQIRRMGGYYFVISRQPGILGRYHTIGVLAAGAHPDNVMPNSVDHPYYRFATRYSELLWHPEVHNVWNPYGMVVVRSGIWWENYVREQMVDIKHRRLIIHLINPPAQETATETANLMQELKKREDMRRDIAAKAAEKKETPDFSKLDALPPIKLEPDPRTNIAVRIVPDAIGKEWKAARALLIDPETSAQSQLQVDVSDPYFWELKVPELKFWALVVLELER